MITSILSAFSYFVIAVIGTGGYAGVFTLMLLQSVNIPIPSEIVMPFSGFLAHEGVFNFWIVVFVGALGNLAGSVISYKLAAFLVGNGLRERHRIINFFLNDQSIAFANRWFKKYGALGIFLGRVMPVVNTFISFPAGLAKMPMRTFLLMTALGAFAWNFILAKIGFTLGENWTAVEGYFRKFDYLIVAVIAIVFAWRLWRHFERHSSIAESGVK